MSKSKHFCFTLNNYNELEIKEIENNEFGYSYCIYGKEVAPSTGTPHLQGYMQFTCAKRFTSLKKINPRINWSACKGSDEDNYNYCSKDKIFFEFGTRSTIERNKQGQRTDLIEIKNSIIEGKKVDDIIIENPQIFHQYGRTLSRIEDIELRKKFRNFMTECDWIYGETGVGKSHTAFQNFTNETHYLWKLNDKGWQDGYTGQPFIIINDFRGEIPYNELLNLIDKWPYTLPRRGREPVPLLAKKITITSSLPPEEIYWRRSEEDSINQLLRRIKKIYLAKSDQGGNTIPPDPTPSQEKMDKKRKEFIKNAQLALELEKGEKLEKEKLEKKIHLENLKKNVENWCEKIINK